MKVLIGIPIHENKDKKIRKLLRNVSQINYSFDLLLVDSSGNIDYVKTVDNYCIKYGIKNYKIKHFDISQEQSEDEMVGKSREIIRLEVLNNDYNAWFSWDINLEIPNDTLENLVRLLKSENYSIIHQAFGTSRVPIEFVADLSCTLVSRICLEKYSFHLKNQKGRDCWHGGENWFKNQVVKNGGSYAVIYGKARPMVSKKPKVLIGTAVHEKKDYSLKRWLDNVPKLKYPADILIVDNTPGLKYVEKA